MVVPVLIDTLIRLLPGVSPGPLFVSLLTRLEARLLEAPSPSDQMVQAEGWFKAAKEAAMEVNLLSLLGWQLPTLTGPLAEAGSRGVAIQSWGGVLALGVALLAVGLFLGSLYLAALGQTVRHGRVALSRFLGMVRVGWLRLAGYRLLQAGVLLLAVPVLGIVVGLVSFLGPAVLALFTGLLVGVGVLVAFYLFLVEEAMFVGEVGPLPAIGQSVAVVYRNFWSCLGLWLVLTIVGLGMGILWVRLAPIPLGTALASLGNAYVATGLALGAMVYYWERCNLLPQRA